MPPLPTVAISAEDSVWPDIQAKLILPPGMMEVDARFRHSIRNLLSVRDSGQHFPIQLVAHRGLPDYASAIPDSSMEALRRAVTSGNAVELDVLWIDGKPCVMHDLTGVRQTRYAGLWSKWSQGAQGQPMPNYIQRDVRGTEFTTRYVPTKFPVTPLHRCLWDLITRNAEATFFLDGRNEDAAKLVAFLSEHPKYRHHALVQVYPYKFKDGAEFVKNVNNFGATETWKKEVAVAPILNPDTLPTLAGVGPDSLEYSVLYDAGRDWFTSMISAGIRIFGLGFPVSGIGHGVDRITGPGEIQVRDLDGRVVNEPKVKAIFLWDRVLLDLVLWAKNMHPTLPIIMHSITYGYADNGQRYTYSFHTGNPIAWPEGAESHGKELMAVPGNALKFEPNILICDRMTDNLNAVLGTRNYVWPIDVDYPTNNVQTAEAE